ncbi:hypothetical protein AaE_007938 [Aphanomyces astaci]|uniref:DDE Tnp4 domain-containing protein n=1 Tax=Aphanomyces astaci TaxID=112090 RepID=A0A6A5AEU8_APHAT|nr:hypothetical protein AaE_007938 [Aphanomyces astaci]
MVDDRAVVSAAILAVTAACLAVTSTGPRHDKYNILTWFLSNLRCGQATFIQLVRVLRAEMVAYSLRVSLHSFEKKVAIFLYFLGSTGGYRETAAAFGVSKSWSINIVHLFSSVLYKMAKQWICMPSSASDWSVIERQFREKRGLPGVVGAIDGTLIDIQRPKDYDGFYNRNGDPSLNVQAVVDASTRFLSIDVRPGSYSDKKIWKCSVFGQSIRQCIPRGCYVLGDAGYTLFPWLIVPYMPHEEGGRLTPRQKRFNFKHSSTRMPVECAFGRLKERFRILKCTMSEITLSRTVSHIVACLVLHNMFLQFNDGLFSTPNNERDRNIYFQPSDETEVETNKMLRAVAVTKRNGISRILDEQ